MRVIEILELGHDMRREAAAADCISVNSSHFIVHEVMLRAFRDDPALIASSQLQGVLSARLQRKLKLRETSHCRN